jgi:hypothetical protein
LGYSRGTYFKNENPKVKGAPRIQKRKMEIMDNLRLE